MTRIAYVDGRFVPQYRAQVAMEDRGYQFADGVYEVVACYNGVFLDEASHLDRLERSLEALQIPLPCSRRGLSILWRELLRRNSAKDALLYLQITRGVQPRSHLYPNGLRPVLTMAALPMKYPAQQELEEGVGVALMEDLRWQRCDVKSIALLPNILNSNQAARQGMKEAWQISPEGYLTEGTSSNAFLVDETKVIHTHPANHHILGGVTRDAVMRIARDAGYEVREEAVAKDRIITMQEGFLTSTSCHILPVTRVDGKSLGDGMPGEVTKDLMMRYGEYVRSQTGK